MLCRANGSSPQVCPNDEVANRLRGLAVRDGGQDRVEQLNLLAPCLVLHDSAVLAEDSEIEGLHQGQHDERRFPSCWGELLHVAKQEHMYIAETGRVDTTATSDTPPACVVGIGKHARDTLESVQVRHADLSSVSLSDGPGV